MQRICAWDFGLTCLADPHRLGKILPSQTPRKNGPTGADIGAGVVSLPSRQKPYTGPHRWSYRGPYSKRDLPAAKKQAPSALSADSACHFIRDSPRLYVYSCVFRFQSQKPSPAAITTAPPPSIRTGGRLPLSGRAMVSSSGWVSGSVSGSEAGSFSG